MTDNEPKYIIGTGWRYEIEHSMLRRMSAHDYQSRSVYMITLTVADRIPLLGRLHYPAGKPEDASIEPTELGKEVKRCWQEIPRIHPEVKLLAFQLMPDHVHGLLFVTREMNVHLGNVINGFKVGCNKAYRVLIGSASLQEVPVAPHPEDGPALCSDVSPVVCPEALPVVCHEALPVVCHEALPHEAKQPTRLKHPKHGMLFSPGYQDTILSGKGQLDTMFRYIADNPRRLAIKRENPELFRRVSELSVPCHDSQQPMSFAAIGNRWLLDRPVRMQVRCHNNQTPENLKLIEKQKAYFLDRAQKEGTVVVSPCISSGEKEIARAALDAGVPLIVILENGFPPMYKPPGKYFEACANGLLLMLAPWPYHMEKRTITRQQCLELNDMAGRISTEPWTKELEERLKGDAL